jgi:hypothetical protein
MLIGCTEGERIANLTVANIKSTVGIGSVVRYFWSRWYIPEMDFTELIVEEY